MIISVTRHGKIDHIDDYIVVMLAAKPNKSFPILMVKNQNKMKSTKDFFLSKHNEINKKSPL